MRGLAGVLCAVIGAMAFALSVGLADAARFRNESLSASGALTYTWQGDPARGCAATGVCDIRGQLIIRAQPQGGQLFAFGNDGATIAVGSSAAVRVLRGGPSPGVCVDIPGEPPSGLNISLSSRGALRAAIQASPGSGRCAGPLQSDLGGITIPVRRTGGSRPSFDLRGSRSFGAGPFTVTFASTLMLRPAHSLGTGFSSSSSSGPGPRPTRQVFEYVRLRYRVSPASTGIQTLFSGAGNGACVVVDSCGASGSLSLSVHPSGTFMVFAGRIVHRRRSAGRILGDLRRGRLTANGFSTLAGSVAETYTWGDGSRCRDLVATPRLELSLGFPRPGASGARIPLALVSNTAPGAEVLRTHCPGPADADLLSPSSPFGGSGLIASGWATLSQLLAKRSSLDLRQPGGFAGLGYTGSRQGSLRLNLTLIKVSTGSSTGP